MGGEWFENWDAMGRRRVAMEVAETRMVGRFRSDPSDTDKRD